MDTALTENNEPEPNYALEVANDSYRWYSTAAIRSRRFYRTAEVLQLLVSAAIPVAALAFSGSTLLPGLFGSALVVITGLRSTFHWQENYLRFSQAREAVEAERRAYRTQAPPYDDRSTRDQMLVSSVTAIERHEMGAWLEISASQANRNEPKTAVSTQP